MAQIWEYIKIALMNIKSNKGRSVLTMLGIIIGIASVIMVMAIGNGVRSQINDELESMGSGLIELYLDTTLEDVTMRFSEDDFDLIMENIDHVKGVTPILGDGETLMAQRETLKPGRWPVRKAYSIIRPMAARLSKGNTSRRKMQKAATGFASFRKTALSLCSEPRMSSV